MISVDAEINESDIGIKDLILELWNSKISIISVTSFFTIISIIYAFSLPNIYQSSALLKLVDEDSSGGGMSALAAQYGATAALAGFQLPSTSSKKPYYAIEILQSKMFVNHLLSFDDTLPKLMATDFYDTKNKRIVFDTDKYDANTKKWIGKTENNKYPTKLDVFEVYSKNLSVDLDKLSGFITIRFEHLSPKFAKEFLDLIINELNAVTKQNTLKDAEASMEYLENYLSKTYQKDIKISINALIEAQLKSKMYASTRDEFFLKIIDNPFIPEEKSSPARSLIVILGFFIGCIVSFFIVLLKLIKRSSLL